MKYFVDFATLRPQNPDIAQVKLHPENANEKKLLDENADQETIELYYHAAVSDKLPGYVLLEVIDTSLWPYAAQLKVQRVGGIG